jgi:hypothetical protein
MLVQPDEEEAGDINNPSRRSLTAPQSPPLKLLQNH